MTVNLTIRIATSLGMFLIVLGVGDYVKYHGMTGYVPLADFWQNAVVIALGVILWCLAAALTSLAAIDAQLHE